MVRPINKHIIKVIEKFDILTDGTQCFVSSSPKNLKWFSVRTKNKILCCLKVDPSQPIIR